MINRQFRVYIKVLLLSIGLISCTVIKKKSKDIANTEATNYEDSVLSNKYITGKKSVKDSLKTEDVISFYKRFMQRYILGGSLNRGDSVAMSCLTTEFIHKLEKKYLEEYDCEDGGCLAVWIFVTGGNDDNPEVNIRNMKMVFIGDNWYNISFDKQQKNSYQVKIIGQKGHYKISDIINNNTI